MTDEDSLHAAEAAYYGLPEDIREVLVCLAPFTDVAYLIALEGYCRNLRGRTPPVRLPLDRWEEMLREARERGLLRPHPADPDFIAIPSALTTILRERLEHVISTDLRNAILSAFYATYQTGAQSVSSGLESNVPAELQMAQSLMRLEYENMRFAMELALAHQARICSIYEAMSGYLLRAGHYQRGVDLGESVLRRLDQQVAVDPSYRVMDRAMTIYGLANHQEMLGQHEAAESGYRMALALCTSDPVVPSPESRCLLTMIHHALGVLAYEQRRWKPAEEHFQKSLSISVESDNQSRQAESFRFLGRVAARVHDWPRAHQGYQQAMDLYASLGNRLSQAAVCLDLAIAAAECGQLLKEAKQYYHQALAFFVEFDDKNRQAYVHHNLGDIAREEIEYKRAWKHYRKALRLFFEIGNREGQARTYTNLGILMEKVSQWSIARRFHRRALQLALAAKDRITEALTYHNLGNLARRCHKWDRAAGYYDKAMEIYCTFNDSHHQVRIRLDLGHLAYKQGRWTDGLDHLLTALRQSTSNRDDVVQEQTLKAVARLWRKSGDSSLPEGVAQVLGTTQANAEAVLRKALRR